MALTPGDIVIAPIRENITAYRFEEVPLEKRIQGLQVLDRQPRMDDRQVFVEAGRASDIFREFGFRQWNFAYTDAGVIKAFHYHLQQEDAFFIISGKARVPLIDLRKDSPTFGIANTLFAGPPIYRTIRIPMGVAHGYEALTDVIMSYLVSQEWNKADEIKIEPGSEPFRLLGYAEWGRKHR
jgi:dTDP-4-dehydrorhamnose 3,5-epimerase